jgi:alpha-tubulin suppressor-like RCC1 family protein
VSGISTATTVSAGGDNSSALLAGGQVRIWGANYRRQLGDGTTGTPTVPVIVPLPAPAARLSTGTWHSMVVLQSGELWAWGGNLHYQIGNGSNVDQPVPVPVTGVPGTIRGFDAGHSVSVVTTTDGRVRVWGYLGGPTPVYLTTPTVLSGFGNAAQPAGGYMYFLTTVLEPPIILP